MHFPLTRFTQTRTERTGRRTTVVTGRVVATWAVVAATVVGVVVVVEVVVVMAVVVVVAAMVVVVVVDAGAAEPKRIVETSFTKIGPNSMTVCGSTAMASTESR